jgi:hypothetical protein
MRWKPIFICACAFALIVYRAIIVDESDNDLLQKYVKKNGPSSRRADLMNTLRQLLKTSSPSSSSANQISDAGLREMVHEARVRRNQLQAQTSRAERQAEEAASCHNGGPCGQSNLPVMKYIPATGAWDVVTMGNSNAIWQNLMNAAKLRDEGPKHQGSSISDSDLRERISRARERGDADITGANHDDSSRESSMSARMEALEQQSREERSLSKRQQLIHKIRSLIQSRMESQNRELSHTHAPQIWAPAPAPIRTSSSLDGSPQQLAQSLAAKLSQAESVSPGDHAQIESLALALTDVSGLSQICSHPRVAHSVLGVYADSSLASCERQLRRRIATTQERLRDHVEHVEYSLPSDGPAAAGSDSGSRAAALSDGGEHQGGASAAVEARAAEKALTRGVRKASDRQRRLRAALDLQRRRMTALVQERQRGGGDDESPPTPDQQAASEAAAAAAAAAKTKAAAAKDRQAAWSPPVPAGLPPGYRGPLRRDGATAVPAVTAGDDTVA